MCTLRWDGCVAQLVEQRIENPRVAGSIPAAATTFIVRFPASVCHQLGFLLLCATSVLRMAFPRQIFLSDFPPSQLCRQRPVLVFVPVRGAF